MKCSRFTQSFVQQYARQEYAALRLRTLAPPGGQPEAVCMVAVQSGGGGGRVLGTLDVRPPASAAGRQPKGPPEVRGRPASRSMGRVSLGRRTGSTRRW